ncbi:hypothetical protein ACUN8C_09225 [Kushneria sp. Sum13]|uniref:hypothetical protein n=1 Tax=Kushneria sp. Sum13 TaxID=3459196 RepID=UPI0040466A72
MRHYRAGLLSLSAGLVLVMVTTQGMAASQERAGSEAQQRFERAQQHSRIQSGEARVNRQKSSLRNQQTMSGNERPLQQQQLRQSQRELQADKRRYQQRSNTSATGASSTTDNDRDSGVR